MARTNGSESRDDLAIPVMEALAAAKMIPRKRKNDSLREESLPFGRPHSYSFHTTLGFCFAACIVLQLSSNMNIIW